MVDSSKSAGSPAAEQILLQPPASASTPQTAQLYPPRTATAGPPQSAAYPAIPSAAPQQSQSGVSMSGQIRSSPSGLSTTVEGSGVAMADPQNDSSEDTVIAGRKGSSAGTIAVPSGQATVPWSAVTGAPPGYPGDPCMQQTLVPQQDLYAHFVQFGHVTKTETLTSL